MTNHQRNMLAIKKAELELWQEYNQRLDEMDKASTTALTVIFGLTFIGLLVRWLV